MLDCLLSHTELICIHLLLTCFGVPVHVYSIPLSRVALGMEQGRSDLSARQVFAVFTVVILTTFIIIHLYQVALHSIFKILLLCQGIWAQHYLVLLGDIGALQKSIANYKANVLRRFKSSIVLLQLLHHCREEFFYILIEGSLECLTFFKQLHVLIDEVSWVVVVFLEHYKCMNNSLGLPYIIFVKEPN